MVNFEDELQDLEEQKDLKKFDEVVKDADSPEKAEALLELLEEDESPEAPEKDTTTDTTKVDDKKPEEVKTEIVKSDEGIQKEISPEKPALITIDDDYIAKADPKDKNILESIKGGQLDEKSLGRLVNAQRKIGEQGNELGLLKQKTEIQKPIPEKIPAQTQTLDKQVRAKISEEVLNRLKPDFPDIPTDPEELNMYLDNLSRQDYDEYKEKRDSIRREVETDFNTAYYKINNHEKINDTVLNNDLISIKNELKEWDIEDPKALGFDLNLESPDKKTLDELMLKDGKFDSSLVEQYGQDASGKPLYFFKEGAIREKFFRMNTGRIVKLLKENLKTNTRVETVEAINQLAEKAPNSATKPKGAGSLTSGKAIKDISDIRNINNPDDAKKLLEMMEQD